MNCKYKVNIKDIQYNYKVKMEEIQSKYKFNIFCRGYDDSDIKGKIDDMYNAWPKVTGEGEEITLNDTVNASMPLGLKGNTYQEGTPTPDTPQEVHVVTGDNEIKVDSEDVLQGITLLDGYINSSDTVVSALNWYHSNYIDITNYDYYIIDQASLNSPKSIIYNANKTPIQVINLSGTNIIINLKNITGAKYLRISVQPSILNKHHLFARKIYPITLPEGMFMGWIGNYQEYIYKQDKKWYLEKNIGKVVLNGTESWNKSSTTAVDRYLIGFPFKTNTGGYCNKYIVKTTLDTNIGSFILNAGSQIVINYAEYNTTNLTQFKTYIENLEPTVYYVLATPITTEITDTTLISQLDAIEKAESYTGQTNISQVNNDAPFIITASTLKDLSSLGTSTVSTLNTANVNRLQTPSISPSLNLNNLELNNEDLELNNLEETIEETPEEE